ncbi:hypothetical protein OGAPHI_000875 [Ogataea philodendri]|uniref:Major facilitator superfamily (MFS) profile domain-containing protein n=1 Tax=Ogataea philodendri TaxID=1378263 RepID=A0A9P8TA26_9ASCO|nr:uncharacterized protein OGAPHI_000875 [Ogataea philodendri]KAH3671164.1 hypothetical protein OGAPHI_000875 [Ogataea philodendri]
MKINTEAIPGTVHLVDYGTEVGEAIKEVVLSPTPNTLDPNNEPLLWNRNRKYLSLFCVIVYTYAVGVTSAAIYSVLENIVDNTNLTLDNLNQGTGCAFLFYGWGCVFWQALALQYGKRPVYLFTCLATALLCIWTPYTNGYSEWIGSKILTGFFGAPIESLLEISISDIYFEHERGTYMGVYALSLVTSNYMAPLVAGFIADGQGWKWVRYWCAIFDAVCFVVLFFLMEETKYSRPHISVDDEIPQTAEKTHDADALKMVAQTEVRSVQQDTDSQLPVPPGKTYAQRLKLLDKPRPFMMHKIIIRQFAMLRFPGIVWAGFQYGTSLVWFNVLNATASSIYSSSPYNFSTSIIGVTYACPIIFCFIFSYYTGITGDKIRIYLARKSNGVSEPEHRLWLMLLYLIICPFALILWGVGAYHKVHWFGIVFGMGLLGGTATLGCSCSVNYVVESYRELSGQAMVPVILIRNTMSFAINYGITPWVSNQGLQNTFIAAAGISIACIGTFVPMIYTGKYWRNRTKLAYWTYLQEALDTGMAH